MSRPVWFVNFLKTIYPSRRILAKLTNLPLIGDLVDYLVFRGDVTLILPKDQYLPGYSGKYHYSFPGG